MLQVTESVLEVRQECTTGDGTLASLQAGIATLVKSNVRFTDQAYFMIARRTIIYKTLEDLAVDSEVGASLQKLATRAGMECCIHQSPMVQFRSPLYWQTSLNI